MFTRQAVALPLKQRALRGRRLVVVDIENVVGGAVLTAAQAEWARRAIHDAIALGDQEQVIIGTSHAGLLATGVGWEGARLVVRSGSDGADLALLDVLAWEHIAERFDELVLVSGDGIFTDAVAALAAQGLRVTVLAHSECCAKRLQLAAGQTAYFGRRAADLGGVA